VAQTRASNRKVLVLAGDGIGPEIMRQALRVIEYFDRRRLASFEITEGLVGGAALDESGVPLSDETLAQAVASDAVLFGAVGDWKYDKLERSLGDAPNPRGDRDARPAVRDSLATVRPWRGRRTRAAFRSRPERLLTPPPRRTITPHPAPPAPPRDARRAGGNHRLQAVEIPYPAGRLHTHPGADNPAPQGDVGAGIGVLAEILDGLAYAIAGPRIGKHQRKLRRIE